MKVTLRFAWSWVCPKCATPNLAQSVNFEATEEERKDALGVAPHEEIPETWGGEWQTAPEKVMCRNCAETYETENPK